jgi:hypothetical protein
LSKFPPPRLRSAAGEIPGVFATALLAPAAGIAAITHSSSAGLALKGLAEAAPETRCIAAARDRVLTPIPAGLKSIPGGIAATTGAGAAAAVAGSQPRGVPAASLRLEPRGTSASTPFAVPVIEGTADDFCSARALRRLLKGLRTRFAQSEPFSFWTRSGHQADWSGYSRRQIPGVPR